MIKENPTTPAATSPPASQLSRWLGLYPAIIVFSLAQTSFILIQIHLGRGYAESSSSPDYVRAALLSEEMGEMLWILYLLGGLVLTLVVFHLVLSSGRSITLGNPNQPPSPKLWRLKTLLTASLLTGLSLAVVFALTVLIIELAT